MKQDFVFHGVELLLNYYLSLFMTKRFFAGGMLALLACVSFASCTTGGGEEVQYVKIGQNLCSFLAEGNQPLEIDVKASPAEWTVEAGATWVKAERTADRTLTVTVEDNDTGSERSAVLTVTAGQAVQEIGIRQLAADGAFARFRKLDTFSMGAAMSPSGRYAGGFVISIAPDDSYQYSPTIVDLETDEWHQFGPYPESVYALHQTMAVTDQGLLFISDGTNGGQIAIDLNGDIFIPEAPADFQFRPEIQGTSADGNFWVGFGKKEAGGLYYPLLWIDGAAQELSLPEKNYREEELRAGVMARSISANGEVIYGTSWDNSDYGMLYWRKEGAGFGRPQIEDGSVPFRQGVHARLYLSRRKFVEDRRRYGAAEVRRAHFIGSLQRVPAAEIGHDRIDEYPSAPTLERSVAAVVAYARIERHETVVQQVFRRGSVAHIAPYDAIHRTAVAYVQFAASLRVPPAATLYYLFQCQRRSVIR